MSVGQDVDTNQELNAENVMETLGEPRDAAHHIDDASTPEGQSNNTVGEGDPLHVQKRLKQQSRQHQREMWDMQAKMDAMQSQLNSGSMNANNSNQSAAGNAGDDPIQRAVNLELQRRDNIEQQKRNAENQAYIQSKHSEMRNHFDAMDDRYDDFREKVFDKNLPITSSMSEYALTLPTKGKGSAGEVLYHLAKNPDELKRISKLHPIDQASEMSKLAHALISGGSGESATAQPRVSIGNVKTMPQNNSGAINDKTPVSSIRAQMKAGKWK